MKKHIPFSLFVTFLFLIHLSPPSLAAEAASKKPSKIVIAADEWCPYNCTPQSDSPGFMVEITRAALKMSGIEVEYQITNWSRTAKLVAKGALDGAIGVSLDEIQEYGFINGEESLGQSYFAFVARKDLNWTYEGPASLPKINFAVIQDYDNGPEIAGYLAKKPKNVIVQVGENALEKNIKLITSGRIDASIDDASVASFTLARMGLLDETKLVALDKEPLPIYMAFSPGPQGRLLARLLDDGIRKLRKTGDMAKILAKYGQQDWK